MKPAGARKERVLILDGGMGTEILKRTGRSFELPELLNLEKSDDEYLSFSVRIYEPGTEIIGGCRGCGQFDQVM